MSANRSTQFRALERELQSQFANATTEITEMPSGAVNLDVHLGDRMFVLCYFPSNNWFGVDEVLDDDGFTNHYRLGSSNFDEARAQLVGLLDAATTPT